MAPDLDRGLSGLSDEAASKVELDGSCREGGPSDGMSGSWSASTSDTGRSASTASLCVSAALSCSKAARSRWERRGTGPVPVEDEQDDDDASFLRGSLAKEGVEGVEK